VWLELVVVLDDVVAVDDVVALDVVATLEELFVVEAVPLDPSVLEVVPEDPSVPDDELVPVVLASSPSFPASVLADASSPALLPPESASPPSVVSSPPPSAAPVDPSGSVMKVPESSEVLDAPSDDVTAASPVAALPLSGVT